MTSAPLLGQCLRDRGPSREPVTAVGPFSESVRVCLIACHLEPAPRCWSPACSVTKACHGDGGGQKHADEHGKVDFPRSATQEERALQG